MNTGTADMTTTEQRLADALRAVVAYEDDRPGAGTHGYNVYHQAEEALAAYDAQQAATVVTWSPSMNRWRDQTGTAHAYMPASADPVCGARPYSSGGHYTKAEDSGAHACRRCKRALAASGVRHA